MFKKIVLILIVLFAGLLVYVGMQSSSYTITRKITINANPEKIFPYLNNAKLAEQWGPWEEVDPQAVMVYSGASALEPPGIVLGNWEREVPQLWKAMPIRGFLFD